MAGEIVRHLPLLERVDRQFDVPWLRMPHLCMLSDRQLIVKAVSRRVGLRSGPRQYRAIRLYWSLHHHVPRAVRRDVVRYASRSPGSTLSNLFFVDAYVPRGNSTCTRRTCATRG
jgi:hypothetical protein